MVIIEEFQNDNPEIIQDSKVDAYISIPEFYTYRSVFITGGTGFIGKVLIEKLLRSCPKIKNIFMLIREKRGKTIENRLDDFLNCPVFDKIRQENVSSLKKIIPIVGDMTLDKLGISESDEELLCRNVSVVFHCAATVKMNEKLKLSIIINTLGTKRIVELCQKIKHLDVLVHVSTAYCHTNHTKLEKLELDEITYPPPFNPNDIISLSEWLPEDLLDTMTPSLIDNRPNTYTFCKALAEDIVLNDACNLPVVIVRPSIVISSLREPLPGWLDNPYGPNGCLILNGLGFIKIIVADPSKIVDLIPVDIVTNLLIVSAWKTATSSNKNLMTYNCVSGNRNGENWGNFYKFFNTNLKKYPFEKSFWYPFGIFMHKDPLLKITAFFLEVIPLFLLDLIIWIIKGKRMFLIKKYQKYSALIDVVKSFSINEWKFKDKNVQELYNTLSTEDKRLFYFDIAQFNWKDYVEIYVKGLRKYMLKQNDDTLEKSRKRLKRMYWINLIIIFGMIFGLFYFLFNIF